MTDEQVIRAWFRAPARLRHHLTMFLEHRRYARIRSSLDYYRQARSITVDDHLLWCEVVTGIDTPTGFSHQLKKLINGKPRHK